MDNRRSKPRLRSFMQGRIYFNKRKSSLDCVVRDLSDVGAKLKVSNSITLPESIEFYIPSKQQTCRAKVEWRAGDEIGIAFIPENASPSIVPDIPDLDMAARVVRLETAFAALQRQVDALRTELGERQGADS